MYVDLHIMQVNIHIFNRYFTYALSAVSDFQETQGQVGIRETDADPEKAVLQTDRRDLTRASGARDALHRCLNHRELFRRDKIERLQ